MGVGGQRHAPIALSPEKRPGTHSQGVWVSPCTGMENLTIGIGSPDRPARSYNIVVVIIIIIILGALTL
jgi:hypothetical protein